MSYKPEFYEFVTSDGKVYLSYQCFTCNTKHLIRTSRKEISRIRSSYKLVMKRDHVEKLILHCGKKEKPVIESDGFSITIMPKTYVPKQERDNIRKRIDRIKQNLPRLTFGNEQIASAEKLLQDKIKEYDDLQSKITVAKSDMMGVLAGLKEGD